MNKAAFLLGVFLLPIILLSQSENQIKSQLEGMRVEVLIEMPATSQGIDLYADRGYKMDFEDYSRRIKENGIALFPGDVVMITKIKKKSKHIEFQLAGGGFGTFGDDDGDVHSDRIAKTSREEEIEKLLSNKDKEVIDESALKKELRDLKRQRELEQDKADRDASLQSEMKRSRILEQKKQGGSRFNIRYDYKVGAEELTVESIMEALKAYVSFDEGGKVTIDQNKAIAGAPSQITKGMTIEQAIALYGMPRDLKTSTMAELSKTDCTFEKDDSLIKAVFVENVLVKYTVTSR